MATSLLTLSVALAVMVAVVSAAQYQDEIIAKVKEARDLMWQPGHNFHPDATPEFFATLTGISGSVNATADPKLAQHSAASYCEAFCKQGQYGHDMDDPNVPENFDARDKWPQCPSIGKVHDQGDCKADYAISTTSAIADRICIASGGKKKTTISAQQVVSCCQDCGSGCRGGFPQEVWSYLRRRGIASGGAYNSNEGCQPYLKKPIGFSANKFYGSPSFKTPKCKRVCYNKSYGKHKVREDLHKGKEAERLCCCSVLGNIFEKGPVTTTMVLYEDFLTYKSGIYHHVHGKRLGHISVKVIGFGVQDKKQYWIAVNSWSENWGDKGTFKIWKGDNGVEFEDYLFAGDVDV